MSLSSARAPTDSYIEIRDAASSGSQVVLSGGLCVNEVHQDVVETFCDPITFVSSDGISWQDSDTFAIPAGGDTVASAVWPVPGGWEALTCGLEQDVWTSTDGLVWSQAVDREPLGCNVPAVNEMGTRLVADKDGTARLQTSEDGVTWREVAAPFTGDVPGWWVTPIAAPADDGPDEWLVVVQDVDALNVPGQPPPQITTYASADLVNWTEAVLPRSFVAEAVTTPIGFVANALNACRTAGPENRPCPPEEDQRQYLSVDGVSWQEIGNLNGMLRIAAGPAGVLAVNGTDGRVWRLELGEGS